MKHTKTLMATLMVSALALGSGSALAAEPMTDISATPLTLSVAATTIDATQGTPNNADMKYITLTKSSAEGKDLKDLIVQVKSLEGGESVQLLDNLDAQFQISYVDGKIQVLDPDGKLQALDPDGKTAVPASTIQMSAETISK